MAALSEHGIPFDPTLDLFQMLLTLMVARAAITLMQLPDPPTALFCFNDNMAMGAYYALRKQPFHS